MKNKHPFFSEINNYPKLKPACRFDITDLPKSFLGIKKTKAILLGADPTNNGIKNDPGLKKLDYVFGINSVFEQFFFNPQMVNLKAINLSKDDLFIQNVCCNYFVEQTSGNKFWKETAKLWLPYLKEELSKFDKKIPVLVTAEKILGLFYHDVPSATEIYSLEINPCFYSDYLEREIYPLYRHPKYLLSKNWEQYRTYLIQRIF